MSRVAALFETMEYGPAPESDSVAVDWLDKHGRHFGHFIDNAWVLPEGRQTYATLSPATGDILAKTVQGTQEDVHLAVSAATRAHTTWSALSGHDRSRHLYNLARQVQKHSRLIAVVEALDNGKSIRETRDSDVLIVIRHLYYYAGWAELLNDQLSETWQPVGVVGAIVPWNFPLMLLTWKVAPALAAGNTVVLKPATYTRLSALLFAELCAEAGLPKGVFNVVTGGGAMGQILAEHPNVDKVAFTGSTEIGKILRQATAGSGKKLSLELGGKSPVVVYENADLDSAVESVVDAIFFNQGHVCSAGSKLLVQEPVYEKFISKLKLRMKALRVGHSLDKVIDVGAVVSEEQKKSIEEYVESAIAEGADVFQTAAPEKGCFYPPTLITGVNTASRVVEEEIFGPVLVALPFRTAKEAIGIANNTIYGLAASVHTEQLTLALETAKNIKAGTVWINCHNIFDAAAGFGGFKQSGFGRDGGVEGFLEYLKPAWQKEPIKIDNRKINIEKFGSAYIADGPTINVEPQSEMPAIDRTYKLYYGGSQKRPDGMYSKSIKNQAGKTVALVGQSNRKDVRNAVEAAVKGQTGWAKRSGFNRAQIIYYIAENLEIRKQEFAEHLSLVSGNSIVESQREVDKSIQRLFYWAAFCDKYGGTVQETQLYGTVIKINEPVGVIGVVCPRNECPLLSLISLMGAAICRSNSVILIPDEANPLPALDLYQVFETSDLPGGVVNILTGDGDHMAKYLAEHHEVDSIWYFGSKEGSKFVEHASACNVKRTWVNYGEKRDWYNDKQGQGGEFLYHAVEAKNVHLTMGDIFAN